MGKRLTRAVLATCLALAAVGTFGQTGTAAGPVDYANATYRIDNEDVKLSQGNRSVPAAPGSAMQRVTRVFGKPVFGRLQSKPAAAVFLVDEPGGSGAFVYAAVALGGGRATNAVALGDRIVPRSIAFKHDGIVVTYLDRKPDEPMIAKPTVHKRVVLRFDPASIRLIEPKTDAATHVKSCEG